MALTMLAGLTLLLSSKSVNAGNFNKGKSHSRSVYELESKNDVDYLVSKLSEKSDSDPWHFSNLYDSSSKSFFIPYHLWTGMVWNGSKSVENCMHQVNKTWEFVDARGRNRKTRVSGPAKLIHPVTGIVFDTWELKTKRGVQNLVCHSNGIGRVFDFRFSDIELSQLDGTECKFPAGFGWKLGVARDCDPNAPKETTVTKLIFDDDFKLTKMTYVFTKKKGFQTQRADDYYEYEINKGRILHSKL